MQPSPPPDRFLRLFAHELRNPLAALSTALTLAAHPARRDDGLRLARRQVDRLTRLVNDVLDAVHLRIGDVSLEMAVVDVDALLTRLLEVARAWTEPRRQPITPFVSEKGLRIRGDPDRLEQMLVNLLHNASKFSADDRPITLTVTRLGDRIRFDVRDEGSGMTPADIAEAFDPFGAGAVSRSSSAGGLGIGLSMARGLAELHGGELDLRSEGPGHGTTASVWLPQYSAAADDGRALRVLIATVDADLRDALAASLTAAGHEVRLAATAAEALRAATDERIDAVALDPQLPDARGTDLAVALRRTSVPSVPPLVSLGDEGAAATAFDRRFPKPIDPDDLTAYLEIAVARRSSP